MGHAHRFIRLTAEQDTELREIEHNTLLSQKVRLRASVLRLSSKGFTLAQLAEHFDRTVRSIQRDFKRFEAAGVVGLADGKAPGNKSKFRLEIEAYLQAKLAEERVWNCNLLSAEVKQAFGVGIEREAMRAKLHTLGYSWKRGRYVPAKQADPEQVALHRASLETLKKGRETASWPERTLPGLAAG